MNVMKAVFVLICLAFSQQPQTQTRGWHGIVPLHSTRPDVERLLGSSREGCHCTYNLGNLNVFVQYSKEPCTEVREPGWNVPKDTVINISVYPKVNPRFSDLKIDQTKYIKTEDAEIKGMFSYFNENEGITIVVDGEIVSEFGYGPTKGDEHLRCPMTNKKVPRTVPATHP